MTTFDLRFAESFFRTPGRLLDLGCGTGRLSLHFTPRGYRVLGVDLSLAQLQLAAQRARQIGIDVPMIQANLVELDCLRDAGFDYAACLFSTLGMVSREVNRRRLLGHVYRVLVPGGRFLLHVHNLWFHLGARIGRRWLIRDRWRKLRGHEAAGDFVPPAEGGLSLHHFTRREIVGELRRAGFRVTEVVPLSLRPDCRLPLPWLFAGFRCYGFLLAAQRP